MNEDFEAELYETQREIDTMLDNQKDFKYESLDGLPKPFVQLSGNDGNAFAIIGNARKALRGAGWTKEQVDLFQEEATSGDYDKLLGTVMKYCEVS